MTRYHAAPDADREPTLTDTFHHPCHTCGQAIDVVGGTSQPHECRTYDTDAERICAAYWAGHDRATGVNDRQGALFPPSGADDAPDESKGRPSPAPVAALNPAAIWEQGRAAGAALFPAQEDENPWGAL